MKRLLSGLVATALVALAAQVADAGTMTLAGPTDYQEKRVRDLNPSHSTVLDPNKSQGNKFGVEYLKSTAGAGGYDAAAWTAALKDFNKNQAKADWTLNFKGTALDGTLTIDKYRAEKKVGDSYGADAKFTFKLTDTSVSLADLRFIQKVYTNKPIGNDGNVPGAGVFKPESYIDPRPGDDVTPGGDKEELPFYWRVTDEDPTKKDGTNSTYVFTDFSSRGFALGTFWKADLFIAVWKNERNADGTVKNRSVDIYDGVRWGWKMVPEPSSVVLCVLGTGFVLVASLRRKRAMAS